MASRAGSKDELDLNDPEMAEAWMTQLAATARMKKLTDSEETKGLTDLFLSRAGLTSIRTLSLMAAPKKIEDLLFKDVKTLVERTIRPKKRLVISERTRFLSLKQDTGESIIAYFRRLRSAAASCEFENLGTKMSKEDDLIIMRLIDGLIINEHKRKILERLQESDMSLEKIVESLQQLELIRDYNTTVPAEISFASQKAQRPSKIGASQEPAATCRYCGTKHSRGKCPAYGKQCLKCSKRNHFASVCRSKFVHLEQQDEEVDILSSTFESSIKRGLYKNVAVNGESLLMQIDTGADVSLIPQNFWKKLGSPSLRKCNKALRQFDGSAIACLGQFSAALELEDKFLPIDLIVTKAEKHHGLLGMDNIKVQEGALTVHSVQQLGLLKDFQAKIKLVEGSKPFYCAARTVPIHLRDSVRKELQRMETADIIEPVPPGGSQWASPIVNVLKPNGRIRVCADFKAGVNHQICNDTYPLPDIETIFSEVPGMTYFARLDLSDAYLQIELDKDSREITTIATPIGLYRYKRLVPGLKSASAIFQKAMETVLSGVKHVIIYQDDILLGAKSENELDLKAKKVVSILTSAGMTINLEKSILSASELTFLGFRVSGKGISPDPALVQKILDIKAPSNRKQLESFLGLANFFGRFIPNYSQTTEPLNQLRGKDAHFLWGPQQAKAFDKIKGQLSQRPVIQPFDKNKATTLTTDASEKSIAAVLSQQSHPVMYFSRRLSETESRYSNIEREALAIVWAMERAKQFLLGSHFTLETDHRPLEFLLGRRRQLPKIANARLLRWAIKLMAFDFDVIYTRGSAIPHADALSRLDFKSDAAEQATSGGDAIHWANQSVIPWEQLQFETRRERLLNDIIRRIETNRWSNCSPSERPFKSIRQALLVEEGVLCYGDRPVIPASLRPRVLELVHCDTHLGANSTRSRLQTCAWWPGYCADVEAFIRGCHVCSKIRPSRQSTVHTWPSESEPWHRVHMDHAHVPRVGLILILVDSMSGWPEAMRVPNRDAATVKRVLQAIFSRNGVPHVLVSDNASEFCDSNFTDWLQRIGCRSLKTPPRHPQSNGIAERMVQSIKKASQAWNPGSESYDSFLFRLLLNYRCIPHAGRTQSPAQLMGRQLRNPVTMRTPITSGMWYNPGQAQSQEKVRFLGQKGTNTALIERESGRVTLAHADQLKEMAQQVVSQNGENLSSSAQAPYLLQHPSPDLQRQAALDAQQQPPPEVATDHLPINSPAVQSPNIEQPRRYPVRANRGVPPLRFEGGVEVS